MESPVEEGRYIDVNWHLGNSTLKDPSGKQTLFPSRNSDVEYFLEADPSGNSWKVIPALEHGDDAPPEDLEDPLARGHTGLRWQE